MTGWESLTPPELCVVSPIAGDLTNSEIASQLFVSVATIKSHVTLAFEKLGVANRAQLVRVAKAEQSAQRT